MQRSLAELAKLLEFCFQGMQTKQIGLTILLDKLP